MTTNSSSVPAPDPLDPMARQALAKSIVGALGIEFLPPGPDHAATGHVEARMPVDERTCQPYGFLSGGASLALAESLSGYGSFLLLPKDCRPVGATVMANHIAAMPVGGTVRGKADLVHKGKKTHVWTIDIVDEESGRLISTVRVQNMIVPA